MSVLDPVVEPGVITAASVTAPALRSNVRYSARYTGSGNLYAVSDVVPLNSVVPPGNTTVNIVPAVVGDPCLLVRTGGVTRLVVLTERLEFDDC